MKIIYDENVPTARIGELSRYLPLNASRYRRVIREINQRYDPHSGSIRHINQKWRNNLIESDHAAMKRLLGYRQSFRSLRSAKATLSGIKTIRTIKKGNVHHKEASVSGEIRLLAGLFQVAADAPHQIFQARTFGLMQ